VRADLHDERLGDGPRAHDEHVAQVAPVPAQLAQREANRDAAAAQRQRRETANSSSIERDSSPRVKNDRSKRSP
jgi:hypothetical protein